MTRLSKTVEALAGICAACLIVSPAAVSAAPLDPIVELVSAKLDEHPLVGIGDYRHGWQESHLLRVALIEDPRVLCKIDAFAIEWGNSRLQPIADRYVSGEPVTLSELRSIWRETGQWTVWDSPVYEWFFEAVREANASKKCPKPVRVLLADPPIDWSKIQSADDYQSFRSRDEFYADVVQREILSKGKRAILIAGDSHLWKVDTRMAGIIERNHPGAIFTITYLPQPETAEAAGLPPPPSVTLTKDTELGKRPFATWMPPGQTLQMYVGGNVVVRRMDELGWPATERVIDAFIHLGPGRDVEPPASIYHDPEYQALLRRKAVIMQEVHGIDFLSLLEARLAER